MPMDALHENELPIVLDAITEAEVSKAAGKLRQGRAGGMDNILPEFWRAACEDGTRALEWIT
eukprot:1607350-Pyramimonas_sp.AAC.1